MPERIYRGAERAIEKAGRSFLPIGAYDPYRSKKKKRITELFLRKYIKMTPPELDLLSLVRTGVEFCDIENSKKIAKGVTSEHFAEALRVSRANKHRMICYFISGVEPYECIESFFDSIDTDYSRTPDVRIVGTVVDPQPCTPFYDFDITKKQRIDSKRLYWAVSKINKRMSVQQTNFDKATYRTLAQRVVSVDQLEKIPKSKKHEDMIDVAAQIDMRLVGESDISDIRDRSRNDNYIGKTVIPYWEV